jgi:hypothetical protein
MDTTRTEVPKRLTVEGEKAFPQRNKNLAET